MPRKFEFEDVNQSPIETKQFHLLFESTVITVVILFIISGYIYFSSHAENQEQLDPELSAVLFMAEGIATHPASIVKQAETSLAECPSESIQVIVSVNERNQQQPQSINLVLSQKDQQTILFHNSYDPTKISEVELSINCQSTSLADAQFFADLKEATGGKIHIQDGTTVSISKNIDVIDHPLSGEKNAVVQYTINHDGTILSIQKISKTTSENNTEETLVTDITDVQTYTISNVFFGNFEAKYTASAAQKLLEAAAIPNH